MSKFFEMDSSFVNFLWDLFIKSHESKESLLESSKIVLTLEEKKFFIKKHFVDLSLWKKIFEERIHYLYSNITLDCEKPQSIIFDERFGWVVSNLKGHSVQLGKSNFSGNIKLKLQPFTFISGHNTLKGPFNLSIGRYCSLAENLTINCGPLNHPINNLSTLGGAFNSRWPEFDLSFGNYEVSDMDVEIEHDVWIGRDVKVYPGSHISSGCVIAEGSIVKGICHPYGIYAGKNAKLIRFRFHERIIEILLDIQWWKFSPEILKFNSKFFQINLNNPDIEMVVENLHKLKRELYTTTN